MTLDKNSIFSNAKYIYHPGSLDLSLPKKGIEEPVAKLKQE